jgi:hypothetical protein
MKVHGNSQGEHASVDVRPEYFFTAVSMLMTENHGSVFPEILYLVNPEQLKDLCATFGGQTVRIPTTKELSEALKASAVAHFRNAYGATDEQIVETLKITKQELRQLTRRTNNWSKAVADSIGMQPGLLYKGANNG